MTAPYEVTYRNMWPSDSLNACIRMGANNLAELPVPMDACRAWFERGTLDSGLKVRIEVVFGDTRLEAKCSLPAQADHSEVCEVVDSTLRGLRRDVLRRAA
ncbi:MAG: hypothetical protein IPJ65_33610 [Archangiaceae bacterium]|nr:hypothetical protein [Archangiaceae bacterium]